MAVEVLLQPVGVHPQLLEQARAVVEEALGGEVKVRVLLWSLRLDYRRVFDWSRGQLKAWVVNEEVYRALSGLVKPPGRLVVAVCAGDAYYTGLNFVFGLASPEIGVASVYTGRLGWKHPEKLVERLAKEILHELGHLLGLGHCREHCVMRFSNSLEEVDEKPASFCPRCAARLKDVLKSSG